MQRQQRSVGPRCRPPEQRLSANSEHVCARARGGTPGGGRHARDDADPIFLVLELWPVFETAMAYRGPLYPLRQCRATRRRPSRRHSSSSFFLWGRPLAGRARCRRPGREPRICCRPAQPPLPPSADLAASWGACWCWCWSCLCWMHVFAPNLRETHRRRIALCSTHARLPLAGFLSLSQTQAAQRAARNGR
jgi:hypothetical protein